MPFRPPRIYPITDLRAAGAPHEQQVRRLVAGGARLVQVRDRETADGALLRALDAAVEAARRGGALLLVNDRPDLARLAGAGGVHLGEDDLPVREARRLLGPAAVIGRSSHDAASARQAERDGADYVAIGPIFATATKPDAGAPVGLEALRAVRGAVRCPIVAIGGITLPRLREVLEAGADSAAVIRALAGSGAALEDWRRAAGEPDPASRGLLFLTGFMGSGKSRVGALVAERLGRRFVDLDAEVEAGQGLPVAEIFRQRGEPAFRAAEAAALASIPPGGDAVVALGGGTLLEAAAEARVHSLGPLVWLDCPLPEALARCAGAGGRPLLRDEAEASDLLARRLPGYRRADLRVDGARTAADVADEIAGWARRARP
jgi:thiamine-phosphate pyrophosphorylase